jgi:putative tryptophan/tyrosine transport system substrate-binding protein
LEIEGYTMRGSGGVMQRRQFITLFGAAAAIYPHAAHAQTSGRAPTVAVLMAGNESAPDNQKRIAAFRQGLADAGWKDGHDIRVVYRWSAGQSELIGRYAGELVALAPDVILANSTPVIAAFKSMTASIPIVFALSIDPVGLGFVKSLSHPGGNITGFTFIDPELIAKWMQLLKDVSPNITRAAVIYNPATTPIYDKFVHVIAADRQLSEIELIAMPVDTGSALETSVRTFARRPGSGVIVGPDPFNQVHLARIAQLAEHNRLPTVSVYRPFVQAGGLMAYGPDTADIFRRSAAYVDRILKGANPADLPVQQPNKFELIINLRTAKELGSAMPPTLLAIAAEGVE